MPLTLSPMLSTMLSSSSAGGNLVGAPPPPSPNLVGSFRRALPAGTPPQPQHNKKDKPQHHGGQGWGASDHWCTIKNWGPVPRSPCQLAVEVSHPPRRLGDEDGGFRSSPSDGQPGSRPQVPVNRVL